MEWILSFWYSKPEPETSLTPFENQLIQARSKLKTAPINDKNRIFQKKLLEAKSHLKSREIIKDKPMENQPEFLTIKLKPIEKKIPALVETKVNPIHEELLKKTTLI
jgi:hypothetical protein